MKFWPTRSMLGALALATLLVAPSGCAGVDESGEVVGEAVEAINAPFLVASPSPLAFGTIPRGTTSTLSVTLTNDGTAGASNIIAIPPDPYRIAHNPPGDLPAGASSNVMQVTFSPTTAGSFSGTISVRYQDPEGSRYLLSLPVTGTAN